MAGAEKLNGLTSVAEMGEQKGETPLPENESRVALFPYWRARFRGTRRMI